MHIDLSDRSLPFGREMGHVGEEGVQQPTVPSSVVGKKSSAGGRLFQCDILYLPMSRFRTQCCPLREHVSFNLNAFLIELC